MTYDQKDQLQGILDDLKWLSKDLQECNPNRFPIHSKSWIRWKDRVAAMQDGLAAVLAAYNTPAVTPKTKGKAQQAEEVAK